MHGLDPRPLRPIDSSKIIRSKNTFIAGTLKYHAFIRVANIGLGHYVTVYNTHTDIIPLKEKKPLVKDFADFGFWRIKYKK